MKPFVFNQPLTKLRLAACVIALFFADFVVAQDVITTPLDNQLFPINHSVTPLIAMAKFTGTITTTNTVRIYQQTDNAGPFTLAQVTTIVGNVLNATVQIGDIGGSFLHTYNYEIRAVNGGVESLIKAVNNIVAGDVYIINGQSNALSVVFNGDAYTPATSVRQFVRIDGSATETHFGYIMHWGNAYGNSMNETTDVGIGQWGMRMASQLVRATNIPVAVFNGAKFGNAIIYFGKGFNEGSGQTNNYIRLLDRIAETKTTIIRGLLWDQGEDDAFAGLNTAQYIAAFNQLFNDWTVDYNPAHFYAFHIRYGCYYSLAFGSKTPQDFLQIMEAERQLPANHSNITVISTNAADQFDQGGNLQFCHYPYTGGYERFGDWATDIVLREAH